MNILARNREMIFSYFCGEDDLPYVETYMVEAFRFKRKS
jgi:hypothetical protein